MNCELFWNEYNLIYTTYESFSQQSLTLKGWSVTVCLAAIIAVYTEKVSLYGRPALLVASSSTLFFWITDAYWKSFQNAFLSRLEDLEKIETCPNDAAYSFGIISDWQDSYSSIDWVFNMIYPSVFLPHALILLLGIYLAFRHPPVSKEDLVKES